MEEVISSSLEGFVFEKNFNSWRSESKYESLGKSFYSLSFNFQKVSNFTQLHTINRTINHNYLFIITFQNLEFWNVTNLPPLKWISSSRFGEASKKRLGFGGLLKIHRSSQGSGVLPPLEAWLLFHQNSYTPSLFLTVSVFSDPREIPSLSSSGSGITLPQFFYPFILVRFFRDWVFLADGSGAKTKQLSISHGGQQFMVSPAGNGSGWSSPYNVRLAQLPCTREKYLYHSKV